MHSRADRSLMRVALRERLLRKASHSISPMHYQHVESKVRNVINESYSKNYRDADELEVETDNHEHFCRLLKEMTLSFGHSILALDLGCGTGRYFHCLKNVDRLMGVDVSVEMLKQAKMPVKKELISIDRVDLIC